MKHNFKIACLLLILIGWAKVQQAQTQYNRQKVTITKGAVTIPGKIEKDFQPQLEKIAPAPGGKQLEDWLQQQKKLIPQKVKNKDSFRSKKSTNSGKTIAKPILNYSAEGNFENLGVPCDNDIAISNDGIYLSVVNSNILAFDTQLDSILFSLSLEAFADTLGLTANMYDPKAIYDPTENRFIMVWLSGNTDSTSNIVVAFSTTPDPRDPWHLYALPGDPVQEGTWSDFPSVAITQDELFISINALINDTLPPNQIDSWKFLFKETGLWQIDKESGYTGQNLNTNYWNDFYFDNKAIRNLFPVKGGFKVKGPDIFFLSNRSFDLENDTIYLAYINGNLSDPNLGLTIDVVKADPTYGLPPDATQPNNSVLQTNDARVLGAFLANGKIHYVQNTVHPDSVLATVYHGIIHDVYSNPYIEGHVFTEGSMEFGYPNISFTGLNQYDEQAIISFNHVSKDTAAGFSALFYKAGDGYSPRLSIKQGIGSLGTQRFRWGDYTGSQKKYNEAGKVWISGYFARRVGLGSNRGWVAAVQSPDSSYNVSVGPPLEKIPTKLFPNPVNDRFQVEFEILSNQVLDISLYNLQGQKIHTFYRDGIAAGKHRFSFSLKDLSSGTYIIRGEEKKGKPIFSEKIIHY